MIRYISLLLFIGLAFWSCEEDEPKDCAGVAGGSAVLDNCNVCDDDPTNDCDMDCAGVWGGNAVLDNCNVCDDNPENDCAEDCAGVWGGNAVLDNCNVCDDDPTNDCALIHLTPISQSIMVGESAVVTIEIDELSDPIFAISMEINYQTSILAFDDSSGFVVGDFFGADHIVFITEESSIIYLTITLLQGEELIHGSGSIGNFTFTGLAVGTSNIQIPIDRLHFFNDSGNEIFPNDLVLEPALINIIP